MDDPTFGDNDGPPWTGWVLIGAIALIVIFGFHLLG